MNIGKKKSLAVRALKVGKERIVFLQPRLDEIKEAITKQDIRDLQKEGAIFVKEIKGRKKVEKRNNRSTGNIRKKVNKRKQDYVIMTRYPQRDNQGTEWHVGNRDKCAIPDAQAG